jgi:hypothetical protein
MGERENKPNVSDIHGLMLFGDRSRQVADEKDIDSYESVDQENKIKIISQVAPHGSQYRYSVLIMNESEAPVTEIKARIKYPDFLILNRITPQIPFSPPKKEDKNLEQILLEFDQINENSKKQLNFYFDPKTLNKKGKISTYTTFVNNKDFVRVINTESIIMKVESTSIMPKLIPGQEIQDFLKPKSVRKAVKSLGIGIKTPPNITTQFNHLEQVIRMQNFQLVAKDENKYILWFFGTDVNLKEDILVIGQLTANKIEFLAASRNHQILISLLSALSEDFKKRILSTGTISSIAQIYDVECKFCGNILPAFPAQNELVECNNCNKQQSIW